jgi:hypothetical protein
MSSVRAAASSCGSSRISTARAPIRLYGRATVVSLGRMWSAISTRLSNPITAMSSGIRRPASRMVSYAPMAIQSLPQKRAVGG